MDESQKRSYLFELIMCSHHLAQKARKRGRKIPAMGNFDSKMMENTLIGHI